MDKQELPNKSYVQKLIHEQQIPIASKEKTELLENKLVNYCSIYMDQIETMSEKLFGALVQRAMTFDEERGLGPGQIPHIKYNHSQWFNEWEDQLWERINKRLDTVSDDFIPKISSE